MPFKDKHKEPIQSVNMPATALYSTFEYRLRGADGFKLALIHISEKLKDFDARIVHTQHDEIKWRSGRNL